MKDLLSHIRTCTLCEPYLLHGVRPVLAAHPHSRIAIIGQAPGRVVHQTGVPWNDKSGERLREWLGVDSTTFYDPEIFALVPMGFCYPGTGSSGDLPPRKECASHWHSRLFERMTHLKLIVLIGAYAQNYYLGDAKKGTLTETVKHFDKYLPTYFVLPHPSPRNNIWLKKNPWFEREVLSFLREKVDSLALSGFLRDDGTPNQKFRP